MIAFDTNVLIYALEGSPQYGAAASALLARAEQDGAVASVLVQHEFLSGVALQNPGRLKEAVAIFADFVGTEFRPVSAEICQQAAVLTARYGRKLVAYDALHIATAIDAGATEFYTNDEVLLALPDVGIAIKPLAIATYD